jgi:hypothetical protein
MLSLHAFDGMTQHRYTIKLSIVVEESARARQQDA